MVSRTTEVMGDGRKVEGIVRDWLRTAQIYEWQTPITSAQSRNLACAIPSELVTALIQSPYVHARPYTLMYLIPTQIQGVSEQIAQVDCSEVKQSLIRRETPGSPSRDPKTPDRSP